MEKIALSKSKVKVSEYMKEHDVSEAIAKEEITADYFGDLLTNKAEIKALLNKNRGLFDIIWEVLKRIGRVFSEAGIDFAEIAEARRLFREALKEADSSVWGEDARTGGEVNFSISEIIAEDGTNYGMGVYLDSNLLTGLTEKERKQMVKEFVVTELAGEHFIAYDNNNDAIDIRIATNKEYFKKEKGDRRNVLKELYNKYNDLTVKQEAIVLVDELIANAKYDGSQPAKHKHGWLDNDGKNDWDSWKVFIQEKNKTVWEATLNIANTANGEKILYDIIPIIKVEQASKSATSTTKDNISQKSDGVNTYSMQDSENDAGTLRSRSEEVDSDGRNLSVGQAEYFKDSTARDEKGNLLKMYHGTPNATFTKFRKGTYFTPHKWYADLYQGQGASSLGYKKTADKPDTYAVYLNIKKPFDTRNKAERDIFYKEYYRQWGTGTDLMESGLPDWMDGIDLLEFLEENDYDYDGVILDEGGVGGYGDEVKSRGISYLIMSPEQAKDINNLTPTSDPDIFFSRSEKGKDWRPDLTKKQLDFLMKIIDNSNRNVNSITSNANWLLTRIDGMSVFAIYSAVYTKKSTLMYESKGKLALLERDLLLDYMEVKENAKSDVAESIQFDKIFNDDGLQRPDGVRHNNDELAVGKGSNGDDRVLQSKSPEFNGTEAFRNVLRDIIEKSGEKGRRDGNGVEIKSELHSRSEDGTKYFPKGEEPRRDIDVPSEIDGKKVMRGARTAAEAPGVSDEIAEDVVTEIENGRFFYTPSVNSVLMANAESKVSASYEDAMADWLKVVGGGRVRDVDIALAEALIIETSKRGDAKKGKFKYANKACTKSGFEVYSL
ncbi:MAG: hypothetical protein IJD97_10345 [Clostridia bacterium]|nr:hypothetical protein [Clostridia bacterium]